MRALVTGGAGFIGSRVAQALVESGNEVRIFDNLMFGHKEAVPDGAELVEGDLRDPAGVKEACTDIDVIFHHAAVKSVPRSMDEPVLVHESNVTGTLNLLIAATEVGVRRLIYASSSSVYGGSDGSPCGEDDVPNPLSPYAVSKLAGEYYCRAWSSLGKLSTVTLRYFNVFGPGQKADSQYAAVFPAFISALQRGEKPVIYGDGEQTRDFTFIDDIVRANLLAAGADDSVDGAIINTAGGDPRSVNDVLHSISKILETSIPPRHEPERVGDVRHSLADPTRARGLLGWKPETRWEDAVAATVDWFRNR